MLNWEQHTAPRYGEYEEVAYVGDTYRIRAVHDDNPENPMDDDGHWPMVAHAGKTDTNTYAGGDVINSPIYAMSDALLLHDQHAIAAVLGYATPDACVSDWLGSGTDEPVVKRFKDAGLLRDAFDNAWDNIEERERLGETGEKLWEIAGALVLTTQTTGYSQSDWADLFIIARPEDVKMLRGMNHPYSDDDKALILKDMQGQANLYGYWAWGDVYGYVIEKRCVCAGDPDDDVEDDWEEIEDGSCWGYFGSDHSESGLEDSALSCLPVDARVAA